MGRHLPGGTRSPTLLQTAVLRRSGLVSSSGLALLGLALADRLSGPALLTSGWLLPIFGFIGLLLLLPCQICSLLITLQSGSPSHQPSITWIQSTGLASEAPPGTPLTTGGRHHHYRSGVARQSNQLFFSAPAPGYSAPPGPLDSTISSSSGSGSLVQLLARVRNKLFAVSCRWLLPAIYAAAPAAQQYYSYQLRYFSYFTIQFSFNWVHWLFIRAV